MQTAGVNSKEVLLALFDVLASYLALSSHDCSHQQETGESAFHSECFPHHLLKLSIETKEKIRCWIKAFYSVNRVQGYKFK